MDTLIAFFRQLGLDLPDLLITASVVFGGLLILLLLGKFIFGKQSNMQWAVSSAIAVIFTCLATIGLFYAGSKFRAFFEPIPFTDIRGDQLLLFRFTEAHYTVICSQVLRMIILAFLVNVIDRWMPQRKNLFSWLFFRLLTVCIALLVHLVVCALWDAYMPAAITQYAPVVLLAVLLLMILTGALKLLVGVLLASVNPIIAALYTFFFATIVGKKITRAVLTTGILAALVYTLEKLEISSLAITPYALLTYTPFFCLLGGFWYLIHHKK